MVNVTDINWGFEDVMYKDRLPLSSQKEWVHFLPNVAGDGHVSAYLQSSIMIFLN